MKIARKEFIYPQEPIYFNEEREVEELYWFTTVKVKKTVRVSKEISMEEVIQQAQDFINTISPEMLVNVVEFTSCRYRIGDDQRRHIIVWYWED